MRRTDNSDQNCDTGVNDLRTDNSDQYCPTGVNDLNKIQISLVNELIPSCAP